MNTTPEDWTDAQQALFTRIYRHMIGNPAAFVHPEAPPVLAAHWETTAWNAAWFAAHCSENDALVVHMNEDDTEFAAEAPEGGAH